MSEVFCITLVLSNRNFKARKKLSGGEATRVQIALLFVKPANVLILDEPTNFIDLPTIVALEKLMRDYLGTVIFTSHDQLFVDRVANEVYQVVDQKLKNHLNVWPFS